MILNFDFSSDIPLYQQLRNQIVLNISQGKLLHGDKLPTVRALADESGINTMTVSKAYQLLKQEGYIITDRRNGAIIKLDHDLIRIMPETQNKLQLLISELHLAGLSKLEILKTIDSIYEEVTK